MSRGSTPRSDLPQKLLLKEFGTDGGPEEPISEAGISAVELLEGTDWQVGGLSHTPRVCVVEGATGILLLRLMQKLRAIREVCDTDT